MVLCISWHLYVGSLAKNLLISLVLLDTLHLSMKMASRAWE